MRISPQPPPEQQGRILHVLRPADGGMRRHVEMLIQAVDDRFHTVAAPPDAVLSLPPAAARVDCRIRSRTSPLHDWAAALSLAQTARKCDLLHCHGLRGLAVGAQAAQLARRPYLVTLHNLCPSLGPLAAFFVRRLLSRATAGIAVSQAVAHSYAWTDADFDIVPNGVDISRFETSARGEAREIFGIPADTRVIASVGRLSPEKGYDTLLRAMESVVQCCPRCLLLLAGDGPQRTELQQQASVFGGQVRLLGAQEDVAPLLAAADVFAAPSRSEGQGIAVLEAMAAGLPVAASGVGGLVEVVADGRTGLLVPPDDPPALAEALCTLLLSPEVGAEMGREGRRVVAERYSLDAMAEAVRAVYGRVTVRAVG